MSSLFVPSLELCGLTNGLLVRRGAALPHIRSKTPTPTSDPSPNIQSKLADAIAHGELDIAVSSP
jgi:hypothetical protein